MNMHKGARLTAYSRDFLVSRITEQGLRVEEAAQASGVSVRTAFKWLGRFRKEGASGLKNRTSRPHTCPHATDVTKVLQIIEQRRTRQTYRSIAAMSGSGTEHRGPFTATCRSQSPGVAGAGCTDLAL
jgi:transposase